MVELLFPYIFFEYRPGGFKYFLIFNPCLGKIPIFTHIFVQLGRNDQLEYFFGGWKTTCGIQYQEALNP